MRAPNILFITCDQLRKDTLGCYGDGIVKTPNIDKIARRGVCFDNTFAAYPVCAPNRASIATGRYPSVHGLRQNGIALSQNELTMMEVCRRAGYRTYGVGKMHLGPQWKFPQDGGPLKDPEPELAVNPQPEPWELPWHGFESILVTEDNRVGPYGQYLAEHGYDVWEDPHSFTYPQHITAASVYPEEHHQTTWIGDRSLDFLRAHDDAKPFFMWTSFVHPHHPFTPPKPYDTMYDPEDMPLPLWQEGEPDGWPDHYRTKHFRTEGGHEAIGMHTVTDKEWQRVRAFYYGMITHIDKQVGRLLDHLEERGMLENTVIAFTSDHGEMLGDHHLVFKGTSFDQVTNVPMILAGPGVNVAGEHREQLGSSIDIMPTLLEAVGLDVPPGVQGKSLLTAAADPTHELRDVVLIESAATRRALRTPDAVLSWHGKGNQGELYDLSSDPNCFVNLWDDPNAEPMKQALIDRLVHEMVQNVDPLPQRKAAC